MAFLPVHHALPTPHTLFPHGVDAVEREFASYPETQLFVPLSVFTYTMHCPPLGSFLHDARERVDLVGSHGIEVERPLPSIPPPNATRRCQSTVMGGAVAGWACSCLPCPLPRTGHGCDWGERLSLRRVWHEEQTGISVKND